jgi:hypothetical protein
MLFSHVFAYLLAFIYLHGIHRLVFLLEEVFSVRYELNIYVILAFRGLTCGFTKDTTRTVRSGRTQTNTDGSVSRQRQCPGTTRTVLFLTLVMTGHEPQQGLYTKTCCLTDQQIRRITCHVERNISSRKHINRWSRGLCSFFSL